MTRRGQLGVVAAGAVFVFGIALLLVQGNLLAPSAAAASDAQLIAAAQDTDEAREFDRNNNAPPAASVDRSGRIAVDLRSGPQARLRVYIGTGLRVEGFLLECPGQPVVTSDVMRALQAGCR